MARAPARLIAVRRWRGGPERAPGEKGASSRRAQWRAGAVLGGWAECLIVSPANLWGAPVDMTRYRS